MKISIAIISAVAAINSGTSATTTSSSPQRRRTIQNKHQSIIEHVNNSNNNYDPYIGLDNKQSNHHHRRNLESSMSMSMGMIEEEVTDNVPSDQSSETEIPPDNNTDHDTSNAPQCSATLMSRHPTCKTCLYACGEVTSKSCAFGEAGTCNFDCANFGDSFVEKQYCVVPQDSMDGADMENMSNDTMSSASIYKLGVSVVVLVLSIGYAIMV